MTRNVFTARAPRLIVHHPVLHQSGEAVRDAGQPLCCRCARREALDLFMVRYGELRRERPGGFTVGREEYGEGFYS